MKKDQFKNFVYVLILVAVIIFAVFIRIHNVLKYNTYWADDGGAHIDYVYQIEKNHRLPDFKTNYLAWHEPGFYFLGAAWNIFGSKIGFYIGPDNYNFTELLNVGIYLIFLALVWIFAFIISNKKKWFALLITFLFSTLFIGVKLSNYINNELLNQTMILFLIILFLYWKLLDDKKYLKVFLFSILLAIAFIIKMTAFIALLSVAMIWFISFLYKRKKYFIFYILIVIFVSLGLNAPWLIHKKNTYGSAITINAFEKESQRIINSDGWKYFFNFNDDIFFDNPYWSGNLNSYFSILLSDTFGDHYNLFNNPDTIFQEENKILLDTGKYTNPYLWNKMINVNRIGLFIFLIWFFGFLLFLKDLFIRFFKYKKIDFYELFLLIILFGGWVALLYNNLKYPYLARGVLKGHFIYFTYPIFVILSYKTLYIHIKNKLIFYLVLTLPIIIYVIIAWPILYVK